MIDLKNITLSKWIGFADAISALDELQKEFMLLPDCQRKDVLLNKVYIDRCFKWAEYFGIPCESVDEAVEGYESFISYMHSVELPELSMPSIRHITFGQFIDAKQIISASSNNGQWRVLQYIITIFTDGYKAEWLDESTEQFKSSGETDMIKAMAVLKWFDALNTEIQDSFTLFQDSGEKEGSNMREHMKRWGWVNFLKAIATTKVFDIAGSGMNSIDCARAASLEDVLVWASEGKDYNIAMSRDMEESYK